MSGAGIGVDKVGRMEGLYKEGKFGRACTRRQETGDRANCIQTTETIDRKILINVSTENGPGLLVINADLNGRACLILNEKFVH